MQLDHDQLHTLLAALVESDIQEFRLEGDDFRLEVRRNLPVTTVAAPLVPVASAAVAPTPFSRTSSPPSAARCTRRGPGRFRARSSALS